MDTTNNMCSCSAAGPGACREDELARRYVILPAVRLELDILEEEGFEYALKVAAHNWWEWVYPNHDPEMCEQINVMSRVSPGKAGAWLFAFRDLAGLLWIFEMTVDFDPGGYPIYG